MSFHTQTHTPPEHHPHGKISYSHTHISNDDTFIKTASQFCEKQVNAFLVIFRITRYKNN